MVVADIVVLVRVITVVIEMTAVINVLPRVIGGDSTSSKISSITDSINNSSSKSSKYNSTNSSVGSDNFSRRNSSNSILVNISSESNTNAYNGPSSNRCSGGYNTVQ